MDTISGSDGKSHNGLVSILVHTSKGCAPKQRLCLNDIRRSLQIVRKLNGLRYFLQAVLSNTTNPTATNDMKVAAGIVRQAIKRMVSLRFICNALVFPSRHLWKMLVPLSHRLVVVLSLSVKGLLLLLSRKIIWT